MSAASHQITALGLGALAGVVPEWVHLMPSGTFVSRDGRGPFRLSNAEAVIAASMQAGCFPIDVNNSAELAKPGEQPAPARGWIVEMQARTDGLWGRAVWANSGLTLVGGLAYRGLNPVFTHDKSGVITQVLRVSLTNAPATPNLEPIVLCSRRIISEMANKPTDTALTADDRNVCRMFGITHEAMLAQKNLNQGDAASQKKSTRFSDDGDVITIADQDVCRKMNLDPQKFAETKRKSKLPPQEAW